MKTQKKMETNFLLNFINFVFNSVPPHHYCGINFVYNKKKYTCKNNANIYTKENMLKKAEHKRVKCLLLVCFHRSEQTNKQLSIINCNFF